MQQIGKVGAICLYPVKSMAGEEINAIYVGLSGLVGDRAYAFVLDDPKNKAFPWHTARHQEALVLYRPRYRQAAAARQPSLDLSSAATSLDSAAFALDVTTPTGDTLPIDSAELAAELARYAGQPVTLHFSRNGLFDAHPVSLFGNATVSALAEEIGRAMDRRRFRANFYADWHDHQPFHEDTLVGCTLQIGDELLINVLERDPRCKMITIDPDTADMDAAILRQVARTHGGTAGIYASVLNAGVVRKGDPISML